MRQIKIVALVLASGLLAAACSSTATGTGTGAGPQKACLDTCEAIARAAERCGGDYKTNYDAAVKSAANGDCKNVTSIRDEASLRSTCIPSLQTVLCADLAAGKLSSTCASQLLRPASVQPTLGPASLFADADADADDAALPPAL
jgi:hypothetical protein